VIAAGWRAACAHRSRRAGCSPDREALLHARVTLARARDLVVAPDGFSEGDGEDGSGDGPVYFDRGTFHWANNGCLGQGCNGAGALGNSFGDGRLAAAPQVERGALARIEPVRCPHSQVASLPWAMGPHVAATGWRIDQAPGMDAPGSAAQIRCGEWQSPDFGGRPLDVSARPPASR